MAFSRVLARKSALVYAVGKRSVMVSNWDFAKAQDELESNPFYSKYATKLRELEKTQPEVFMAKLKEMDGAKKPKTLEPKKIEYPKPKGGTFKRRLLSDIMNVELLRDKTADEVNTIWSEHYKNKEGVIYGSLSRVDFEELAQSWEKGPTFVVPLPRGDGYELFMTQYYDEEVHVTPLIQYQRYGADTPECLCLSFFTSLPQSLVLLLGEYDTKVLSPLEASCLASTIQLFYRHSQGLDLVEKFNNSPETFDHRELISRLQSMSFDGLNQNR